jgi:endonuclease/exonuclease/phosphatase family metal-dependent hydrolase
MNYLNSIFTNYNSSPPLPKMVSSLLTVMTWNMWFDKKNRAQRTETLLNEVRCYDPDIVALQEVVQESLEIIVAKMRPTYYVIGINPSGFPTGYDTLILSKFPPIEWDRYYLPKTKMGRNLLLATLQTQTRQITVGTFHLESVFLPKTKEAEDLKESQLKYIYAISPLNSILMGDTNLVLDNDPYPFPSSESPRAPNNPPIIDVYYVPPNDEPNATPDMIDLGAEDIEFQPNTSTSPPDVHNLGVCPFSKGAVGSPFSKGAVGSPFLKGAGATYCGRTNKHVKNKSIQSRLDRIYVKIKRNSLKVHFYGLTGTFTQPSDHFGVFAQIEF